MKVLLAINCLVMILGFYLAYDEQYVPGIICFLICFIGFRQTSVDPKPKRRKAKPKIVKSSPRGRLNKFSIN